MTQLQTLTAQFASGEKVGRLVLELDDRLDLAPPGGFRIRLYPAVPAQFVASAGEPPVLTIEKRARKVRRELVEVQGADRVSTRWPISRLLSVTIPQVLFALEDDVLKPVPWSAGAVAFDPVSNELILPGVAYGGLIVEYDADYRIAYWIPPREIYVTGTVQAVTVEEGTVLAYYDGKVTTLDINIIREEGNSTAVLAEVVSQIVVSNEDKFDRYEIPPGFPNDTSYPGRPTAEQPDADNSMSVDRAHEYWLYDAFGAVWRISPRMYPTIYKPYVGQVTYKPAVGVRFSSQAFEGLESGYARAISEKNYILERLAKRYSNFVGEL